MSMPKKKEFGLDSDRNNPPPPLDAAIDNNRGIDPVKKNRMTQFLDSASGSGICPKK